MTFALDGLYRAFPEMKYMAAESYYMAYFKE